MGNGRNKDEVEHAFPIACLIDVARRVILLRLPLRNDRGADHAVVATFRIPIAHGFEVCLKERVIAVLVGQGQRISGGDRRRPGDPFTGGYRLILHCRPHRQVAVCPLP